MAQTEPQSLGAEQRAWLAENLTRGIAPELLAERLVKQGVEPATARAEVEAARSHPAVVAATRVTRRQEELRSLFEAYSTLHRQSGWHERLERRADVCASEFFERYYYAHRPIILQGLMKDWPAMENWRPERLAERFGDVQVEVMAGRESDPVHDLEPDRFRSVMPLRDFIQRLLRGGPTNDLYLTARNFALERPELRSLYDDVRPLEGFLRPVRDRTVKLWVGPAGTLTGLHHDLSNILFAQVHGRKHFKLIPSFELHCLYNHHGVWSEVDATRPDFERFPAYRKVDVVEAVLEPGELLFIPVGWWHWVHALDVSVSVSFQTFEVPGGNTPWRLL
ncbi:cupin-like domain-containing protein [Hyalangium versicolor]|uniref:cupin-like domain-containing protein n=1 Tax=Hyalangium versicolor TaxID=2861190 RepID=UPI001CCD5EBA|nr:cupin-like domain-containing protein [Hyalangium versicolor]